MITFLLGLFGYYDHKIMEKFTHNIFYLPYLIGFSIYRRRLINFPYFGIYLFTGEQGSGKTLSMVNFSKWLHDKYEDVPVKSNFELPYAQRINNMVDILSYKGKHIFCIDEMGIWCNSKRALNRKDDINDVLLPITAQNRKNNRLILSTCQQYYQVHKDIRTQATAVIQCKTYFDCLTINSFHKPKVNEDGNVKLGVPYKFMFFLHTQALYDLYNTMEVINL